MKSTLMVLTLEFLVFDLASKPAAAATLTTSFGVTATVEATCQTSASSVAHSNYSGTAASASFTISVNCTDSTPYSVGLSAGVAPGATVASRKMTASDSALLSYVRISNTEGIVNWRNSVGTDPVAGTGTELPILSPSMARFRRDNPRRQVVLSIRLPQRSLIDPPIAI
jgi:spore coat protein U-like protein